MDAQVTWQNRLHFTGMSDNGLSIELDGGGAGPDGQKLGMSPMQLLAVSLVGCTAMDVISILEKMRQDVTGFEVKFHGDRSEEHPKVFTDIAVEYVVYGRDLDTTKVEKAVNLSIERYCSVHAMLHKAVPIHSAIRIVAVA